MRVLATGIGCMGGSHMMELLYSQGNEVLGTYYKPTTDIYKLDFNIKMVECDGYYQSVLWNTMNFQSEQIYHLATQSYPTESWDHPQATMETNMAGTINIFEAVKESP